MIKSRIGAVAPKTVAPLAKADKSKVAVGEPTPTPSTAVAAVLSVRVCRSYTLKIGDEYRKFGVDVEGTDYETASAAAEEYMMLEAERTGEQFAMLATASDEATQDTDGGEDEPEVEDGAEEEADLSPEMVASMTRAELVALVEDNELEIDADTFKNNKKGLEDFRAAVTELVFGEPEDDEAEPEDDEAEPDVAEETETVEETELTADDVNGMTREQLVQLIEENELEIDAAKHPKLSALKNAVIALVIAAEEDEEAPEPEDEPEDDDAAATEYTREELEKLKVADLRNIYEAWTLGKFPAGTPIQQKKLAISRILSYQKTGK